ncbi:MAG: substrate-binding domain-containing protein [Acidimicrobiia bacterium]
MRWRAVLAGGALAVAGALLVSAGAGAATPVITGGGADSADPLIGKWQQVVAAPPLSTPVDYSADGSGSGRADFVSGKVDFVVTSVPFTTAQKDALTKAKRTYVSIPFTAGSIAFLYHLFTPQGDPIKGLRLTGPTLTKIFTGTITNWNDPEIVAENPSLTLPPVRIIPTVRGQESGATFTLTSYMKNQAPDVWHTFMSDPSRNFSDDPRELFPFFAGVDSRTSSFAVSDVVRSKESSNGRIAYVDSAWAARAIDEGADVVKVKNAAGQYVLPSPANAQAALDAWKVDADGHMTPDFGVTGTSAYPVDIVHEIVIPTSGVTAEKTAALRTFVQYALTDGQKVAASVVDPMLPAPVLTKALAALDLAIPPTTTTTTTSSTTPGVDVQGADLTSTGSGSGSGSGTGLALTGPPDFGWLLVAAGGLIVAGSLVRRRVR